MKVTLHAVTMYKGEYYSPSKIIPPQTIDEPEFLEKYAENPRGINVDGVFITTYKIGDYRWIVSQSQDK